MSFTPPQPQMGVSGPGPRPRLARLSAQHSADIVSCAKEERKKKKKNLLFDDLPESPDVKGVQVGPAGQGCGPLTKLGSASSIRLVTHLAINPSSPLPFRTPPSSLPLDIFSPLFYFLFST